MGDMESMRRRIERWRRTQPAYARMPEELWGGAVALARVDGAYAVSRELGVKYATLKRRMEADAPACRASSAVQFVEVDTAQVLGTAEPSGTLVELSGADGAKLTVRLGSAAKLDVVALASTFLRRGT